MSSETSFWRLRCPSCSAFGFLPLFSTVKTWGGRMRKVLSGYGCENCGHFKKETKWPEQEAPR